MSRPARKCVEGRLCTGAGSFPLPQWLRSLRGNKLLGSDGSVSGGKYGSAGGGLVTTSLRINATGDIHKGFNKCREIGDARRRFFIKVALNDISTSDEINYGQEWSYRSTLPQITQKYNEANPIGR
jgi:hypothetical protein